MGGTRGWPGAILLAAACVSEPDPGPVSDDPSIPDPVVSPAPDSGELFYQGTIFDLAAFGYEEHEFFVSGTASSYAPVGDLGLDGIWEVEPADEAEFKSRFVVVRPTNSADFDGTVMVEWFNVTGGLDAAVDWTYGHVELIRRGAVWVGVSAQSVGIEGSENAVAPLHLKAVNPTRYGSLSHPGDSFSYDLFSQVVQALRNPGSVDPLGGLVPERIIATGDSQSASRLTTYYNAFQGRFGAFDGYLLHSRGGRASPLSQDPLPTWDFESGVLLRTDLETPVLMFQTETDPFGLGSVDARQEDDDGFRLWETAGTAHLDAYGLVFGAGDQGDDPSMAAVVEVYGLVPFIRCDLPINSGSHHYLFHAALRALDTWVRGAGAPASADRLELNGDGSSFVRDDDGHVIGGIRSPHVDAPTAVLSGEGGEGDGLCRLFGTTRLFDAEELVARYGDRASYVAAVQAAADSAVEAGFLLQPDADQIVTWAPSQWDAQLSSE